MEENKRLDELIAAMTAKQRSFCDFYIQTGNEAEAARRAGYSEKTARSIGSENLTKPIIKEYIGIRMESLRAQEVADADEVMKYLTRVMRGEEKDQFDLEASLQDRTRAAELLGKRYKLFTNKTEHTGSLGTVVIVDDIPRNE